MTNYLEFTCQSQQAKNDNKCVEEKNYLSWGSSTNKAVFFAPRWREINIEKNGRET